MLAERLGQRTMAAVAINGRTPLTRQYPVRKQLIWNQCQEYLRRPILLLVQLDNLDVPSRQSIKTNLSQRHLSLLTPKPHILRRAVQLSRWPQLEGAVVGPTAVLTSRKQPQQLQEALRYLSTQSRLTLLGGVIGGHCFTAEGVQELVFEMPSEESLRASLLSILAGPAAGLISGLSRAPQSLLALLTQRVAAAPPA